MSMEPYLRATLDSVVEHPAEHKGWHIYTFSCCGRDWRLTAIENDNERPHSLLSSKNGRHDPWPDHNILALDGVISVETCAKFIQRFYGAYTAGVWAGELQAQRNMRRALGL